VTEAADVAPEIVSRLRNVCDRLPDAYEEPAWVGTRWRVRKRTFAHVLVIDLGYPPAYARAAATHGPATVLMFRSAGDELDALHHAGPPFFGPRWRSDEVGLFLDDATDWQEVTELVTDSYRLVAPKVLARRLTETGGTTPPAPAG
jgi:hypothetical protein